VGFSLTVWLPLRPAVVEEPFAGDLLLLPPHAAISIAMTSATATAPPTLRLRDPRTDLTFPPNGYEPAQSPALHLTNVTAVTVDRIGAT
jgi:hypothetical protein